MSIDICCTAEQECSECSITFKVLLNEALTTIPWGRTNKYLRGRGKIQKKKFAHRKNPGKKYCAQTIEKNEQEVELNFKNII